MPSRDRGRQSQVRGRSGSHRGHADTRPAVVVYISRLVGIYGNTNINDMKRKRLYLSGGISGIDRQEYLSRFSLSEKAAVKYGYQVFNPTKVWVCKYIWLYGLMELMIGVKWAYRLTLWYDLQLLKRCDLFTMVGDDWQQSRGARLERMKARQWGIPEMKHTAKEPAWIRNANFDLLAYLQERFKKSTS